MLNSSPNEVLVASDAVSRLVERQATESFRKCMQCATCSGLCPWGDVENHPFNIRKLVQQIEFGDEGFEREDVLYACTTCNLCGSMCPRGVDLVDFVRGCRKLLAQTGFYPRAYRDTVFSIKTFGNPWSQKRENRLAWKKDLRIRKYKKEMDYLLFGCCTNTFDPDRQKSLYAFARLLQQTDISFGVLGEAENCCGESIRKIGAEDEFQHLVKRNTDLFMEKGVTKIITLSPHCYHIFKTAYPELPGQIEIIHYTEMLEKLIEAGQLKPKSGAPITVCYHDPCYLGRHSGIYETPRNVIRAVQNTQLVELSKIKKFSRCCGGGGGGIWLGGENGKLADVRVADALQKQAEALLTACPYCASMLEYSATLLGGEIKVMDLSEFIAACC